MKRPFIRFSTTNTAFLLVLFTVFGILLLSEPGIAKHLSGTSQTISTSGWSVTVTFVGWGSYYTCNYGCKSSGGGGSSCSPSCPYPSVCSQSVGNGCGGTCSRTTNGNKADSGFCWNGAVDATPPTTSISVNCLKPGLGGWCIGDAVINFAASDANGIKEIKYKITRAGVVVADTTVASDKTSFTISNSGIYDVEMDAQDKPGNRAALKRHTATIDIRTS